MKYFHEIEINRPIEEVIRLFDNPDNLKEWQTGLLSFEHVSGKPGEPGAKSRLVYQMGRRKIEMIETVTGRNLPNEFFGSYETDSTFNLMRNYFMEVDPHTTHWRVENEFTFRGFVMKFFALINPGAFKKQTLEVMMDFKEFAENKAEASIV